MRRAMDAGPSLSQRIPKDANRAVSARPPTFQLRTDNTGARVFVVGEFDDKEGSP